MFNNYNAEVFAGEIVEKKYNMQIFRTTIVLQKSYVQSLLTKWAKI